jgi:hypothetical protein
VSDSSDLVLDLRNALALAEHLPDCKAMTARDRYPGCVMCEVLVRADAHLSSIGRDNNRYILPVCDAAGHETDLR